MTRLDLPEVSEQKVRNQELTPPSLVPRLTVLCGDKEWVELAYDSLRDTVQTFRVVIARWSGLLVVTEQTLLTLRELAAQAEELSNLLVRLLPTVRLNKIGFTDHEIIDFELYWRKAFSNAVSLDEKLFRIGGERGANWSTDGRNLLQPPDLVALKAADISRSSNMRLYPERDLVALFVNER